jgi:hypothetical protein
MDLSVCFWPSMCLSMPTCVCQTPVSVNAHLPRRKPGLGVDGCLSGQHPLWPGVSVTDCVSLNLSGPARSGTLRSRPASSQISASRTAWRPSASARASPTASLKSRAAHRTSVALRLGVAETNRIQLVLCCMQNRDFFRKSRTRPPTIVPMHLGVAEMNGIQLVLLCMHNGTFGS